MQDVQVLGAFCRWQFSRQTDRQTNKQTAGHRCTQGTAQPCGGAGELCPTLKPNIDKPVRLLVPCAHTRGFAVQVTSIALFCSSTQILPPLPHTHNQLRVHTKGFELQVTFTPSHSSSQ